uniref:Putative 3-5 exonuclease n=1 Tax=Rhipicephalus pulchellus TaxID=72859 RepID=L7M0H0_RHIPC
MGTDGSYKLIALTAGAAAFVGLGAYLYEKKLYKYFQRRSAPNVVVCSSLEDFERVEALFLELCRQSGILGLDCEWVPYGKKERNNKIALLQLAPTKDFSVLLRLCKMLPNEDASVLPESLRAVLDDESIVKLGVAVCNDASKLRRDYGLSVRGCLDLRYVLTYFPELRHYPAAGLKKQALAILGTHMGDTTELTCSNWEADTLSEAQVDYAATDVLLPVQIFEQIVRDRLTLFSFRPGWYRRLRAQTLDACGQLLDLHFTTEKCNRMSASKAESAAANGSTHCGATPKKLGCFRSYMTRKTPLYDNCMLLAPDGEPLSSCNYKKVQWYVDKGLGRVVSRDDEPVAVQLNFEPSNRPVLDSQYYTQNKDNLCVVCNSKQSLVRKNVVPHEYRKYFPEIMKNHISHDILLLCLRCHQISNLRDGDLRRALAKECNAPIESGVLGKVLDDPELRKVRSAGRALVKARKSLPQDRVELLEDVLRKHFGVDEVTDDVIRTASEIDTKIYNEEFVPHGFKVVEHYKSSSGLVSFEMRWRQHFLDTMKPQYMPAMWSVDHHKEVLALKYAQGRAKDTTLSEVGLTQEFVDSVLEKLCLTPEDLKKD